MSHAILHQSAQTLHLSSHPTSSTNHCAIIKELQLDTAGIHSFISDINFVVKFWASIYDWGQTTWLLARGNEKEPKHPQWVLMSSKSGGRLFLQTRILIPNFESNLNGNAAYQHCMIRSTIYFSRLVSPVVQRTNSPASKPWCCLCSQLQRIWNTGLHATSLRPDTRAQRWLRAAGIEVRPSVGSR